MVVNRHPLRSAALLLSVSASVFACGDDTTLQPIGADLTNSQCGRGLAVVNSDYQSTSIALIDSDGSVASTHLLSSASAPVTLTAPLSGDVVLPNNLIAGDDAIIIDRYPASVITWIRLQDASVSAQLDVSTGFSSNPQDVLPLADGRLYISRLESNLAAGQQPFDAGGDLLIVGGSPPQISGRIALTDALTDAPGFLPRPNAMAVIDDTVFVLLSAYDASFGDAAPSRLVRISPATDEVIGATTLTGLYGCSAMSAAPQASNTTARRVAVSCTGRFDANGEPVLAESGVAVVNVDGSIERQWAAGDAGGRPFGLAIDWLGPEQLLAVTLGSALTEPVVTDALLLMDTTSGAFEQLFASATRPFELGQVRCLHPTPDATDKPVASSCGQCWLADAEGGQLQRLVASPNGVQFLAPVTIDDGIGLPPRGLGRL